MRCALPAILSIKPGLPPDALAPLAALEMPVFFVTGNHERYEDLEDIIVRLQAAVGVMVLRNQSVRLRSDVMIHGVEDADSDKQLAQVLPTLDGEGYGFESAALPSTRWFGGGCRCGDAAHVKRTHP